MKDASPQSTRRKFLKIAALGAGLPVIASSGQHGSPSPHSLSSHPANPLDRATLQQALGAACDWLANIAQMKTDALSAESNSHHLEHQHWRGALRGEYRASTRQWDFFCPVWHTGQAVKALRMDVTGAQSSGTARCRPPRGRVHRGTAHSRFVPAPIMA